MPEIRIAAFTSPTAPNTRDTTREWKDLAECANSGVDPEIFYPTSTGAKKRKIEAAAKSVCQSCPVIDVCLETALSQPESDQFGIWGGLNEDERLTLIRRRKRGRSAPKPKRPRVSRKDRYVNSHGTRLRLHALAAIGWPALWITKEAGLPDHVPGSIERFKNVDRATAQRIAEVYEVRKREGPITGSRERVRVINQAVRKAKENGWVPPAELDETRLDDPTYKPTRRRKDTSE